MNYNERLLFTILFVLGLIFLITGIILLFNLAEGGIQLFAIGFALVFSWAYAITNEVFKASE